MGILAKIVSHCSTVHALVKYLLKINKEVELLSRHSLEHIDERLCSSCTGVVVPLETDSRIAK